ncbi:MAG: DUF3267 domain-containing protein [Gammaproteobacteria bacterium]|nr:DUF3267 domain-containing protein [Gammaproteobacteria bacterium]
MSKKLVQFNITAKNMGRICWILLAGPVVFYVLINIVYSGSEGFLNNFAGVHSLTFIPVLLAVYIVHEVLHVAGGMIIGARFSSFKFGFDKTKLSIECHCHDEMSIRAYLFMLLLPFGVLTPLLSGLAYFSEVHLWWMMLTLSTSGCAFDLTVFIGLIGIPGHTRIIPELEGVNGYVYLKAAS